MAETVRGSEEGKTTRRRTVRAASVGKGELNPLQLHGLGLLERVMAVRKTYEDDPGKDAWLMNAINRAVYAAYLDCVEEGVGDSAKAMLHSGEASK